MLFRDLESIMINNTDHVYLLMCTDRKYFSFRFDRFSQMYDQSTAHWG